MPSSSSVAGKGVNVARTPRRGGDARLDKQKPKVDPSAAARVATLHSADLIWNSFITAETRDSATQPGLTDEKNNDAIIEL